MRRILFAFVVSISLAISPQAQSAEPVHISEYMQHTGLLFLNAANEDMLETAKTLDAEIQDKGLQDLYEQIDVAISHFADGPEKKADTNYLLLLGRLQSLATGAGVEINQGKKGGLAIKAWASCYGLAHVIATSGLVIPDGQKGCDDAYDVFSRETKKQADLIFSCSKLKKDKDRRKCEAGKIPPP